MKNIKVLYNVSLICGEFFSGESFQWFICLNFFFFILELENTRVSLVWSDGLSVRSFGRGIEVLAHLDLVLVLQKLQSDIEREWETGRGEQSRESESRGYHLFELQLEERRRRRERERERERERVFHPLRAVHREIEYLLRAESHFLFLSVSSNYSIILPPVEYSNFLFIVKFIASPSPALTLCRPSLWLSFSYREYWKAAVTRSFEERVLSLSLSLSLFYFLTPFRHYVTILGFHPLHALRTRDTLKVYFHTPLFFFFIASVVTPIAKVLEIK